MPQEGSAPGPWLSTEEVAARLGVPRRRIRALVRKGALPAPDSHGGIPRWPASSVDALLAAQDGQLVSVPAAALSPIQSPLALVVEQVIDLAGSGADTVDAPPTSPTDRIERPTPAPLHLRIWVGRGPEGPRVVALLGALAGVSLRVEDAAAMVAARWLPEGVGPSEITWCTTGHDGPSGAEVPVVESVVLAWPPLPAGLLDRLLPRGHPGSSPHWLPAESGPLDFLTLAGVVGAAVDCYPAAHYTAATVTAVTAAAKAGGSSGGPVSVTVDEAGMTPTCAAVAVLDTHSTATAEPGLQRREDATRAAAALAADLQARLELGAPPGSDPKTPPPGARWAVQTYPAPPSAAQVTLLARYTGPAAARDNESGPGANALLDRLWEWADDVGEHSERPDPELESALRLAARRVATNITIASGAAAGVEPRPAVEVRVYRATGPIDRAFLMGLEPVEPREGDSPRRVRRARALEAALPPGDRPGLRFGLDPGGRLVAHREPVAAPGGAPDAGWFALEWPLRPSGVERDAIAVVADADPESGERPVFITGPAGTLTPLPATGHGALRPSWQFGPGAQPRALAGDIAALLTRPDDNVAVARDDPWWLMSRAELELALAEATQAGGLHIELDGFRR